jgi:hypothetical protein
MSCLTENTLLVPFGATLSGYTVEASHEDEFKQRDESAVHPVTAVVMLFETISLPCHNRNT